MEIKMKKISLLLAVFALSATMALAQGNDALIDQTGDGHTAEMDQRGSGNIGELNHQGSNHNGYIQQIGSNNTGRVYARDNNNSSVIIQHGQGHNVQFSMNGEENIADIRQYGTSEHSIGFAEILTNVFQTGDRNEFYATQIGNGDGHEIISLGGLDIQRGDDNYMEIWQKGSGHSSRLLQTGDGNTLHVFQKGDDHLSPINKNGNDNYANVKQRN